MWCRVGRTWNAHGQGCLGRHAVVKGSVSTTRGGASGRSAVIIITSGERVGCIVVVRCVVVVHVEGISLTVLVGFFLAVVFAVTVR